MSILDGTTQRHDVHAPRPSLGILIPLSLGALIVPMHVAMRIVVDVVFVLDFVKVC